MIKFINMGITVFQQNNITLRRSDQGVHIRERLKPNRSGLTLQGGPNQHDTYLPRQTIRANHSSPRLELQNHPTCI